MNVSQIVQRKINTIPAGQIFSYRDLPVFEQSPETVMKAVSNLVKRDKIKRLSKGKFFIPEASILGPMGLSDGELIKSITYRNGKLQGYVTGNLLYNTLGFSTQLPRTIVLAVNGSRQEKDLGTLRIKTVPTQAPITPATIKLLQYLDIIRDIKNIMDADLNQSLCRMAGLLADLNEKAQAQLQVLAINYYNPRTRALVGMLLSGNGQVVSDKLKASLNPATSYQVGLNNTDWPSQSDWNIR